MKESYKITIDDNYFNVSIENMDEVNFDYKDYEKNLLIILEQVQKEFWTICIDFNRHQVIVGRNNLWVAAALIGAYAALYNQFNSCVELESFIGIFFCGSVLFAFSSFFLCLYGMPLRDGYAFHSWSIDESHNLLRDKENNSHIKYLTEIIQTTVKLNIKNRTRNSKRARVFRKTSYLLICSLSLCVIFSFLYILNIHASPFPLF